MDDKTFLIRILVCFVLSFIIGFERQYRRRTIGLRTNVLVCIGSFLFTTVGYSFAGADLTRIPAQIVSGMGFLGAGVILREGKNIRGLNTAATLWCNAAIGVLTASGMLFEATIGAILILFSNVVLRIFANKMVDRTETTKKFIVTVTCSQKKAVVVRTLLLQKLNREEVMLDDIENESDEDKTKIVANIEIANNSSFKIDKIMNRMSMEPDVYSVGWKKNKEDHRDPKDDDME